MFKDHQIPVRRLDRSKSHSFCYAPTSSALEAIAEQNGWRKLEVRSFEGTLTPTDNGFDFIGNIYGKLTQNCVISGAPVHTKINLEVHRHYVYDLPELENDTTLGEDFDFDMEALPQNLELDDLISESLLLFAPDYPKIAEYRDSTAFVYTSEDETEAEPEKKASPFAGLSDLLKDKKNT